MCQLLIINIFAETSFSIEKKNSSKDASFSHLISCCCLSIVSRLSCPFSHGRRDHHYKGGGGQTGTEPEWARASLLGTSRFRGNGCGVARYGVITIFFKLKVMSQIKITVKKFSPSGLSVLVMNYLNWFDIPIFKHRRNRTLNFTQRGARASFTASLGVKIGTSNKFK
jgi:hypothetical protein